MLGLTAERKILMASALHAAAKPEDATHVEHQRTSCNHHAAQLDKGECVRAAAGTAGSIIFQWTAGTWLAPVPLDWSICMVLESECVLFMRRDIPHTTRSEQGSNTVIGTMSAGPVRERHLVLPFPFTASVPPLYVALADDAHWSVPGAPVPYDKFPAL